jgi:hypothetical protein
MSVNEASMIKIMSEKVQLEKIGHVWVLWANYAVELKARVFRKRNNFQLINGHFATILCNPKTHSGVCIITLFTAVIYGFLQ